MIRLLILIATFVILFPIVTFANTDKTKAAFIRDGNLWTLLGDKETQITKKNRTVFNPKWSSDGKWILYQVESMDEFGEEYEIWVYNLETKEEKRVARNGSSPAWAPDKNVIAYRDRGILDITDLEKFYNIASGVTDFSWIPDGSGFLLSSPAFLRPDGWTNTILYSKKVNDDYEDIDLIGGVEHFLPYLRKFQMAMKKLLL